MPAKPAKKKCETQKTPRCADAGEALEAVGLFVQGDAFIRGFVAKDGSRMQVKTAVVGTRDFHIRELACSQVLCDARPPDWSDAPFDRRGPCNRTPFPVRCSRRIDSVRQQA